MSRVEGGGFRCSRLAPIGFALATAMSVSAVSASAQTVGSMPRAPATLAAPTPALIPGVSPLPAKPPAGASVASHYRVSAGDELDVFVWGEQGMQRAARVLPDGTFAFPLAGTIMAVGRTVDEISRDVRERIAINYRSAPPDVTVTVRDATGLRFYVIGKVRTPGVHTTGRAVDILQALSMAGGLAEFADIRNTVILRQTPSGQVVEPVELAKVLKGGRKLDAGPLSRALPTLRNGDVLVVP